MRYKISEEMKREIKNKKYMELRIERKTAKRYNDISLRPHITRAYL